MRKRQRHQQKSDRSKGECERCPPAEVRQLSLEKCRSLLPEDCNLNDPELENLRDSLYCLAGVVIGGLPEKNRLGAEKK